VQKGGATERLGRALFLGKMLGRWGNVFGREGSGDWEEKGGSLLAERKKEKGGMILACCERGARMKGERVFKRGEVLRRGGCLLSSKFRGSVENRGSKKGEKVGKFAIKKGEEGASPTGGTFLSLHSI